MILDPNWQSFIGKPVTTYDPEAGERVEVGRVIAVKNHKDGIVIEMDTYPGIGSIVGGDKLRVKVPLRRGKE